MPDLYKTTFGEAERQVLERYFATPRSGRFLTATRMDGMVMASCVGPTTMPTAEWLGVVWEDFRLRFDSEREQVEVETALACRWDDITRLLIVDPVLIEPIFDVDADGRPDPGHWAKGFLDYAFLHEDAWEPILRPETAGAPLAVLLLAAGMGDDLLRAKLDEKDRRALEEEPQRILRDAAIQIWETWPDLGIMPSFDSIVDSLAHQMMGATPYPDVPEKAQPVRSTKVGRNEPCPCGSGRKYKKCCGA